MLWWIVPILIHTAIVVGVSDSGTGPKVPSRRGFARLETAHCEIAGSRRPLLEIRTVAISPNPIELPGRFRVQIEFKLRETFKDKLSLSLEMHKKFHILFGLYTWIKIPCLSATGVGSCTYEDMCHLEMFNGTQCLDVITRKEADCQCPYNKGHWRLPATEFFIEEVPELPGFLLEGDFHIKATVKRGDKHIACYSTNLKLNLHKNEV
ncbi:ganglioside GM2 activator-like [Varroa jacobsoni]|uniref:Ganglioside GM2 activator n=1 Tax=Varroa destructor TaxID=109461 RepID=A0A7M7J4J2_VARDE|nr:ganglioside GM2 activator-like [Varroa destructor]XP_022689285.1 ganglioside GM2 activator-like [Varroa jacobsoni]XP_022689286.1 ganglioside GM2 activator-like [Varroa jacobsoni]XP_022689287.1 ganglioside GM2 activator-like [Varroa jacobsoni]